MIENIRRKFLGVMFHHIDLSKISEERRRKAAAHNGAETDYVMGIMSAVVSKKELDEAWQRVVDTNDRLDADLQGKHLKKHRK